MKILRIWLALVAVLILFSITAAPVSAQATRIDFQLYECSSWGVPERVWVSEDGILHMRGIPITNTPISSNSKYFAGTVHAVMSNDINLATGEGHAIGKFSTDPTDTLAGTWEGTFSTFISPTGIDGNVIGHGTGVMEGWQFFAHSSNTSSADFCDTLSGYILIP